MEKLYYNGSIITMEKGLYREALLVKDGRILFAGSRREAEVMAPLAKKMDLKGHTLMPGFIDAHSHFTGVAHSLLQISLEECRNFHEIKNKIESEIKKREIKEGEWILVRGYDHNQLEEKSHPKRELLDEISPVSPMVLQHQSGHVGVFNSAGLRELGITEDTPEPPGGRMEKENGQLTGYMEETAFVENLKNIPMPSVETLMKAYVQAQEVYLSYGITTVQEGFLSREMVPLYQELLKSGILKLDLIGYADAKEGEEITGRLEKYLRTYRDHFRLAGYKIFLDGSPQGRTAWLRKPYEGETEYRGYPTMKTEEIEHAAKKALEEQMQLIAHCNGDAACGQYLDALRVVGKRTGIRLSELRPVMIHAQMLGLDQLEKVRELGVIPSFFAAHVFHWGDTHIKNLGRERASHISPAESAWKMGIPFTLHQDSPVIPPDMAETIWCAVNRRTKSGEVLGQEERIDVLTALRAVTLYGAYQYFEEKEKGTLAAGKKADLVILDRDPFKVPTEELKDIKVLETFKEGESLYQLSLV